MIIGICGRSGSGKSTLSNYIIDSVKEEAVHLDIDKVGHKVLLFPEVQDVIIESFGEKIVKDNAVDRKKLGEIVFSSRNEMSKLSNITWKFMQIEIDKFIEENKNKIIVLDWVLLSATKYFNMCDIKILLDIPYEERKRRAMNRDKITEETYDLRDKSCIEYDESKFDYVLRGDFGEEIERMVKSL